jgi:hypothetical protein
MAIKLSFMTMPERKRRQENEETNSDSVDAGDRTAWACSGLSRL